MKKQRVPIYWDHGGVTHACQSAKYDGDIRMVWTLCGVNVLDDQAYWYGRDAQGALVTCPVCLAALVPAEPVMGRHQNTAKRQSPSPIKLAE
jgi:hypothetical protein